MTANDTKPAPAAAIVFPGDDGHIVLRVFATRKDYPFSRKKTALTALESIRQNSGLSQFYIGSPSNRNAYGSPHDRDGEYVPGTEVIA